jgi:hypothetical protein
VFALFLVVLWSCSFSVDLDGSGSVGVQYIDRGFAVVARPIYYTSLLPFGRPPLSSRVIVCEAFSLLDRVKKEEETEFRGRLHVAAANLCAFSMH